MGSDHDKKLGTEGKAGRRYEIVYVDAFSGLASEAINQLIGRLVALSRSVNLRPGFAILNCRE